MRTFIAIELPAPHQEFVAAAQMQLQHTLPADVARIVRWTPASKVHLTLRFLGETDARQRAQLTEALNAVSGRHTSLQLRLQGLGAFPQLQKPGVLWLGVAGDLAALHRLQQDVEQVAQAAGFAGETRSYAPHLTIARVRRQITNGDRRRLGDALQQAVTNKQRVSASFNTSEIVHMRSNLRPSGAVYSVLRCYQLGGK